MHCQFGRQLDQRGQRYTHAEGKEVENMLVWSDEEKTERNSAVKQTRRIREESSAKRGPVTGASAHSLVSGSKSTTLALVRNSSTGFYFCLYVFSIKNMVLSLKLICTDDPCHFYRNITTWLLPYNVLIYFR